MKRLWTIVNPKGKKITAEEAENPTRYFEHKEEAKVVRDKLNAGAGIDPTVLGLNGTGYKIIKGPDHPRG